MWGNLDAGTLSSAGDPNLSKDVGLDYLWRPLLDSTFRINKGSVQSVNSPRVSQVLWWYIWLIG
jgi:hypothetical protein